MQYKNIRFTKIYFNLLLIETSLILLKNHFYLFTAGKGVEFWKTMLTFRVIAKSIIKELWY